MAVRRVDLEWAIESYLETKRASGKAKGTMEKYEQTLREMRDKLARLKVHKVYSIDSFHLEKLLFDPVLGWNAADPETGRQPEPSTINGHIQRMKTFMGWCYRKRYVTEDPSEEIEPLKFVPKKKTYLGQEDLARILDAAHHPRDRALFAIAMFTALRVSEILTMRIGDVDFERQEISYVEHKTKTRDTKGAFVDLLHELRTWLDFYETKAGPLVPSMYLIPRIERPKLNGRNAPQANEDRTIQPFENYPGKFYALEVVLDELGLNTRYQKFHMFRRSAGRKMYDDLCSQQGSKDRALRLVQSYYGHRTRAITERYLGLHAEKEELNSYIKGRTFFTPPDGGAQVIDIHSRKDKSA